MKAPFLLLCVLHVTLTGTWGIPIARAMGCGRGDTKLTDAKRMFCCEEFNVDCPEEGDSLTVDLRSVVKNREEEERLHQLQEKATGPPSPEFNYNDSTGKTLQRPRRRRRPINVRALGERCKEPLYHCAVGLECKQGFCFTKKSRAHLNALIKRGKLIETQEKDVAEVDNAQGNSHESDGAEGFVLYGQTFKIGDTVPEELIRGSGGTGSHPTNEKRKGGDVRSSENLVIEGESDESSLASSASTNMNADSSGQSKTSPVDPDGSLSGMEEDELTANIADLLEKKMGIRLDAHERHEIREIIAGTLDERAEREDQVEASEREDDSAHGEVVTESMDEDTVSQAENKRSHVYIPKSSRKQPVQDEIVHEFSVGQTENATGSHRLNQFGNKERVYKRPGRSEGISQAEDMREGSNAPHVRQRYRRKYTVGRQGCGKWRGASRCDRERPGVISNAKRVVEEVANKLLHL